MSQFTAHNTQQSTGSHADAQQSNAPAAPLLNRSPTHYYGTSSTVLDYILLSCEFDQSYDDSFYEVSDYHTYDRHLINPEYERDDLTTDHAVVSITLTLRS